MKTPIVVGNWKMYTTLTHARQLAARIRTALHALSITAEQCTVILCPPFVNLAAVEEEIRGSALLLGAQNCWTESYGAFTGEVSAEMLHAVGCRYVIVGHSERRTIFGEDDILIATKFKRTWEAGLVPILCIGESLRQRQQHQTWHVLRMQLETVLSTAPDVKDWICAYEPVWAIGTGIAASPREIAEAHAFLRDYLCGVDYDHIPLLYGGSVNEKNCKDIFTLDGVDGVLVGTASLQAESFVAIVEQGMYAKQTTD